jgi:hypothetical protein
MFAPWYLNGVLESVELKGVRVGLGDQVIVVMDGNGFGGKVTKLEGYCLWIAGVGNSVVEYHESFLDEIMIIKKAKKS